MDEPHPRTPVPPAVVTDTPGADGAAEVLSLADAAHAADGHPPLSDQTRVMLHRGGQAWTGRSFAADGALAGAAVLVAPADEASPAVLELVVAPGSRRRGVGGALARAAAEAVVARGWSGRVGAWAHGRLPGSDALARRHGFTPVRELRRLRLDAASLAALPPVQLPPAVALRGFEPGRDEEAWLEVNRAAFATHPEQGRITRADLEDRMAEDWFDPAGLLLAVSEPDGAVLAFHWTKVDPREPGLGEVYVVGVSPAAQGRGLGRAVTLAGLHHLAGRGVDAVDLYVDADNRPAVRLYAALGFRLLAEDVLHAPAG